MVKKILSTKRLILNNHFLQLLTLKLLLLGVNAISKYFVHTSVS